MQYTSYSPLKFTKASLNVADLTSNVQSSNQQLTKLENEESKKLQTESPEKNTKLRALKVENFGNIFNSLNWYLQHQLLEQPPEYQVTL